LGPASRTPRRAQPFTGSPVNGTSALHELEAEPFGLNRHAGAFQRAMALVLAVRDVAAAHIVNAEGDLTDEKLT
jgi:hypothetical protein